MPRQFKLPDLGEGITEAQIVRVLVKDGERITEDQYLMEVETDKAAVEIPSPYAGVATKIHVKEGQTVNVGDVIVTFDDGNGAAKTTAIAATAPPKSAPAPARPVAAHTSSAVAQVAAPRMTTAAAAPAVRKLARETGVDLDSLTGTGPGGRVTKEDVERAATAPKGPAHSAPAVAMSAPRPRPQPAVPLPGVADVDKWGPIRREPINQIRKTIAAQMSRSAFTAVHVTHGDTADVTELDRMRRGLNELTDNDPKLTIMSFVVRATCLALKRHPIFNATLDEEGGQVLYKDYVNMGVAVDTPRGLIVPVIRNADRMTLRDIAAALKGIAERIRTNQFGIDDLRGGSFTITNVGALGGTFSTPIINFPEVAILGLGRSREMPVVRNGQVIAALLLPLNLSFDHRVTDGANAARFCGDIIDYLEHPAKFLLD